MNIYDTVCASSPPNSHVKQPPQSPLKIFDVSETMRNSSEKQEVVAH